MKIAPHFFFSIIGLAVASLTIPHTALAERDAILYISPRNGTYEVGEKILVRTWLKLGDYQIDTVSLDLQYSTSTLQFDQVLESDAFPLRSEAVEIDEDTGYIRWTLGAVGGLLHDTEVATFVFSVTGAGAGDVQVMPSSTVLVHGQDVPVRFGRGVYALQETGSADSLENKNLKPDETGEMRLIDNTVFVLDNSISSQSVFKGRIPMLVGQTSAPNAHLAIEVDGGLVRDKIQSDTSGNWRWSLPSDLFPGIYSVKIIATHPDNPGVKNTLLEQVELIISDVTKSLFRLDIGFDEKAYKIRRSVPFTLVILNEGSRPEQQSQIPLSLSFSVYDEQDNQVYHDDANMTLVGPSQTVQRTLPPLPKGELTLVVQARQAGDVVASSQEIFVVEGYFGFFKRFLQYGAIAVGLFLLYKLFLRDITKEREGRGET